MSHFLSSRYLRRTPAAVPARRRRLLTGLAARVLALALLAGGLVAGPSPQAQAQGEVTVRLEPVAASGAVDDVFTVKVYVDNVPAYDPVTKSGGVQGWEIFIDFDPAVVQWAPGQNATTYFAGNLYSTVGYNPVNIVDCKPDFPPADPMPPECGPTSNRIVLGQALLGQPSSRPSGSNLLLATIQWKGVGNGVSVLDTNTSSITKDAFFGVVYSPLTQLDGQITVTSNPYDVNDDGEVDVLDIIQTAENWLATDPALLAIYDFNDNGMVDVGDIMLVTANLTG